MKGLGLPKAKLLRKPHEFTKVYRRGKRLKAKGFSLVFLAGEQSGSRLGISVHRQIRGAVRRNRIKRMFREAFRCHHDMFPKDSDVIVTVAPAFSLQTTGEITRALAGLARG